MARSDGYGSFLPFSSRLLGCFFWSAFLGSESWPSACCALGGLPVYLCICVSVYE